ncbi:hypothetical protein AGMMS49938_13560 [Fibrobacterales bacterium]|nr:hypothetical protein AGMMS49938_13560 [Fibrobacterales bacterium]
MPIYKIELRNSALKFLKTQTVNTQRRVMSAISELPNSSNIKKMKGYVNRYRLRVGDIRIIYDKFDDVLVIVVVEIGYRGDIYK